MIHISSLFKYLKMERVLITGITGFIGSHLGRYFTKNGYKVIGLKRNNSDLNRCLDYYNQVDWVNVEDDWVYHVIGLKPSIIVHSAWEGVSSGDRQTWFTQFNNLSLLKELLFIASESKIKKIVGLGSQAEYGFFDGKINEDYKCNPESAYGVIKLMSMEAVRGYCEQNQIKWVWLRLFPCFGEGESFQWFIPMLTKKIHLEESFDMTPGEQKYAYLYIRDLTRWIFEISLQNIENGIYNISSSSYISLKNLVEKIKKISKKDHIKINYGALPYRDKQSMLLCGDTTKLHSKVDNLNESDFDKSLEYTVNSIINKIKNGNQ